VTNVVELLDASNLAKAREAAQAVRDGWTVSTLSKRDDAQGMRMIYAMRLDHLRKEPGAHAAQLAESVAEFVKGLEGAADVQFLTISSAAEHDFIVFFADSGTRAIGCLRTVSQLNVSPDRWTELWRHAT